jgi:hypothetical protein
MGRGESFAFFVRIPYLWFRLEPDPKRPHIGGAGSEMDLSGYRSEIVNPDLGNTQTAIRVCYTWFVILNTVGFQLIFIK